MKKTYIYLLGIIIVLSSCNNKPDNETSTQDQLFMTGIRESATPAAFSNIFGEVTALMISHYDSYASGMPSKSIKETQADDVSTIDMPLISYNIVNNQFTIDYGTSDYKGADNNLHRGKYYISTSCNCN